MKAIFTVFILGLSFGCGPCLAGCGPLFLAYVAGTGKGISKSIKAYLLFSVSRVFVYLALGLLFFAFGRLILGELSYFSKIVLFLAGLFIIMLGILMALGKGVSSAHCVFLRRRFLERDRKSVVILGIFAGLLPCAPLVSVFTFTGLAAKSAFENLIYSFSFGLGTIVSPLLVLAVLAGLLPGFLNKLKQNYAVIFNIICGLIMVFLGLQLIGRAS